LLADDCPVLIVFLGIYKTGGLTAHHRLPKNSPIKPFRDDDQKSSDLLIPSSFSYVEILRILSLVVALAAGTVVVGVAIPTMHPCLADGFRSVLETEFIAMVIGAFGVLAAGLAARALVPPPSHEAPRWLRRLSSLARPA
jgi:hypothetical protein